MQNRYSKLEVRPKSGGGLYDTYRFLLLSEIDRQYNMCFMFSYNMQKKRFSEHVKQFSGIDCIFIGDETDEAPPLVVLQEDMQTIMITELKVKDDLGLPRGDLKLKTQVKALYSTPFRNGLAVLYCSTRRIKFSMNRIASNSFDDFRILEGTADYFRLNYNEVVFNIVWQSKAQDEDETHGALITNEKIYIIDSHLKALRSVRIGANYSYNFIFSSYWLGKVLLYTTEDHLFYTTLTGDTKIVFSFPFTRGILCNVLADRVSVASYTNEDEVQITTRKVFMLEPIIMAELSYINKQEDFDSPLFKALFEKLDTDQVSTALVDKLLEKKISYEDSEGEKESKNTQLNALYNAAWFLIKKKNCPQFTNIYKYECLTKLQRFEQLFELIFDLDNPAFDDKSDLERAIARLTTRSGHTSEKNILSDLFMES